MITKIKKIIINNLTFIKYIFSAGTSFALDLILFTIFSFLLKGRIIESIFISTVCARAISSFVNYILNRNVVFKSDNSKKTDHITLIKYYILVIIQMCISGILVTHFYNNIKINPTIIKIPVEIVLFMINYFVQKFFIFNERTIKFKINPTIKYLILAILTTFTILIDLDKIDIIKITRLNTNVLSHLILGLFLFNFYKKYDNKYQSNWPFRILSLLFSLLMVLGYSYDMVGNASLVFGNIAFIIISIIKLLCFYKLFNIAINLLYDIVNKVKIKDLKSDNKFIIWFNKHPFVASVAIILLCYIPYIIAFYPAILGYDPANQIKEVMGLHTRYMDSVILLDPNVTITNFNPVLHTLLLGGCFKLGHIIGNDNLGLFLYSIIQIAIMISALAYSISYMKKEGVLTRFLLIVLAIYALVPVFPFYAMTTNKDTIFCSLVLIYVIRLYDLIKNPQTKVSYVGLFIISLLVTLTRNNGIYTIFLSLPFALVWLKDKRKGIVTILVVLLMCYVGYNKVILPSFKISNTSIREMLSIPFQQTARLAREYPDAFSEEDKKVVDKVLNFETLDKRYQPGLSDKVKNEYNIYTTNEDLKEYFKVWFKGLTKRPVVYIDATISNIYGYFYPDTSKWYIYYKYNTKLEEAGYDYHYNSLEGLRNVLSTYGEKFPYIPIIGMFVNIAFVGWLYFYFFAALLVKKAYKYIPFILPALSFILVCVAGPANTYFRYALPYVFTLPVTICLLYNVYNNKLKSSK